MSTKLIPVLNKIKKEQAEAKLFYGAEYNDNKLILCKENGSPFDPDLITKAFNRNAKKAGFENVTFHSLRHYVEKKIMVSV